MRVRPTATLNVVLGALGAQGVLALGGAWMAPRPRSAQDGAATYTAAQADAGRTLYAWSCARRHGEDLSQGSAPPLRGPTFRRTWSRSTSTSRTCCT